jgi:hypothetical protein
MVAMTVPGMRVGRIGPILAPTFRKTLEARFRERSIAAREALGRL